MPTADTHEVAHGADECACINDPELVARLVEEASSRGSLIAVLQHVQSRLGYLPEPVVNEIARICKVPASRLYGIITFYAQFSTERSGRFKIHVCEGTACHVAGVSRVTQALSDELGVEVGGTTPDYLATLETVSCVGACALAPVVRVNDDETYGKATPASMRKLVAALRERDEEEQA
jgi:NADH-quinone oxidoreductase subunit E